jgi:hypothetical protein
MSGIPQAPVFPEPVSAVAHGVLFGKGGEFYKSFHGLLKVERLNSLMDKRNIFHD